MRRSRAAVLGWQLAILVAGLSVWEWGWDVARATLPRPWVPKILDPYFISKPSAIWRSFLRLGCLAYKAGFAACTRENSNNLWLATLVMFPASFVRRFALKSSSCFLTYL